MHGARATRANAGQPCPRAQPLLPAAVSCNAAELRTRSAAKRRARAARRSCGYPQREPEAVGALRLQLDRDLDHRAARELAMDRKRRQQRDASPASAASRIKSPVWSRVLRSRRTTVTRPPARSTSLARAGCRACGSERRADEARAGRPRASSTQALRPTCAESLRGASPPRVDPEQDRAAPPRRKHLRRCPRSSEERVLADIRGWLEPRLTPRANVQACSRC